MQTSDVLILDIETAPLIVYSWGIRKQYISPEMVLEDYYILSFSAKWLGAKEMLYEETRNGNDKPLLKKLWKLLDKARYVITQNGDSFDWPRIKARMSEHGMLPPSPFVSYDTLKASSNIAFSSHKLSYMAHKLKTKHQKLRHERYPGNALFIACRQGDPVAWKLLKVYNNYDVLVTEDVYYRLRPWAGDKLPKLFHITDKALTCGTCGNKGPMREGSTRKSGNTFYCQHSCLKCGAWQRGEKVNVHHI